ncbi:MAG: DUF393 domain-containing protein [Planctomycetes bacterium]|nr:DUF393 domain-containing protein [Planctomycetota bacterium]
MTDLPQNRSAGHIILYDGVCGLCHRTVQFVLKRDKKDLFRFAALQSPWAQDFLRRRGLPAADLDTVYLIIDPETTAERILSKGEAYVALVTLLGGAWKIGGILGLLPKGLLRRGYDWLARRRYRLFGRFDQCPIPRPEDRRKFIGWEKGNGGGA